jgi:NOL1/NOP2/sun family putative RNA methylase
MDEPGVRVARFAAGPRLREWSRRYGFSDWMVARFARLSDEPQRFLDGLIKTPPRYLRANPLRASVDEVQKRLEGRAFELARNDLDPNVLRIDHAPISPGATMEHMLGMTTMQDLASASAPLALAARPGEVVADLAAAPGVKAIHVAGDLGTRGAIVAVEPDAQRIKALRFNLERCGVASVVIRAQRAQDVPGTAWADRVLLDAPCTGEGTLPKDKNRRYAREEEIPRLAAVQSELLDAADRILKPGGTLVYATCTFAPEENEVQIQRLVARGYRMEDLPFRTCGGEPLAPAMTEWPGYELDPSLAKARRFLPGIHPTLGFFVARLRKGRGDA